MARYSNWKFIKGKSLSSLILDELNPRMPNNSVGRSQADLIADLVENDDVLELAKNIAIHGFFPNSDILVMPHPKLANKWVVLEGNRRVTALKILRRPELAPAAHQKKCKSHSAAADLDSLAKVNVWTVPDRASAEVYLAMKHAPPDKGLMEQWTPMQKASFYGRFLGQDTIDEIANRFSTSTASVAANLRMFQLYELARRLPLTGEAKKAWEPRNFPYSVVERIFESTAARKLLRVKLLPDGEIEIDADLASFKDTYQKILQNIGPKKTQLNTRTLDSGKDIENEIGKITGGSALPKAKGGALTSKQVIDSEPPHEGSPLPDTSKPKPGGGQPPPRPPKRYGNGLFSDKLVSFLKDDRLPSMLDELQKIEAKHHNATGVLVRIVLEMALIGWLKRRNEWQKLVKISQNKKFGPIISEMFKYIQALPAGFANPLDPQELNAVASLLHKGDLDQMNGWVHNPNFPSDPAAVQTLCTRVKPLLERLLTGK